MAAKSSRKRRTKARPARRKKAVPAKSKRNAAKSARAKRSRKPAPRRAKRARPAPKRTARKASRKIARKQTARPARKPPVKTPNPRPRTAERPTLDRTRRVLSDDERFGSVPGYPATATESVVATPSPGRHMTSEIERQTESTRDLTAGDPDARWQDAYAVGDEAPGGDNPTPDQDRVDDIGRALGIEYADGQELQGGDEVVKRDKHRWELDPASSEDWPHGDKDTD